MALLVTFWPGWTIRSPKSQVGLWLAVLLLLCGVEPKASARTTTSREYQIKAVFLLNFAQFVEWPPRAFEDAQSPLVIGVLGDDPFDSFLDETVRGEKINSRPMVVQRYQSLEEIGVCHVLFISRSMTGRLEQIFRNLKGRPILTVGDIEGFALHGGMIRFVTEHNRVRFRINVGAAKAAELTISSNLLRPAEIISPGKD